MENGKKRITFPYVIPGNKLDGREYTFNDIDGGIRRLADFNLKRNEFFGGSVTTMGMIKSLGIWACIRYETRNIVGFYIDVPERVTEAGQDLIRKRLSNCEVVFERTVPAPTGLSDAEREKRAALRKELAEYGVEPELISRNTAGELEGLLKAIESGKSDKKMATVAEKPVAVYEENPTSTESSDVSGTYGKRGSRKGSMSI